MKLRSIHNVLIFTLLILGILLPKIGTAVSLALASSGQSIVICTGDGLQQITIDENGNPVSSGEIHSDVCYQTTESETEFSTVRFETSINFSLILKVHDAHSVNELAKLEYKTSPRAPPVV